MLTSITCPQCDQAYAVRKGRKAHHETHCPNCKTDQHQFDAGKLQRFNSSKFSSARIIEGEIISASTIKTDMAEESQQAGGYGQPSGGSQNSPDLNSHHQAFDTKIASAPKRKSAVSSKFFDRLSGAVDQFTHSHQSSVRQSRYEVTKTPRFSMNFILFAASVLLLCVSLPVYFSSGQEEDGMIAIDKTNTSSIPTRHAMLKLERLSNGADSVVRIVGDYVNNSGQEQVFQGLKIHLNDEKGKTLQSWRHLSGRGTVLAPGQAIKFSATRIDLGGKVRFATATILD